MYVCPPNADEPGEKACFQQLCNILSTEYAAIAKQAVILTKTLLREKNATKIAFGDQVVGKRNDIQEKFHIRFRDTI